MTYSCARFGDDPTGLDEAQAAKHELICRKLGLHDARGCACSTSAAGGARWRCTPHATTARGRRHHDQSRRRPTTPAAASRRRTRRSGRDPPAGLPRRAAASSSTRSRSIGMFEHVGAGADGDLLLDAARAARARRAGCSTTPSRRSAVRSSSTRSFIYRYVFPDGELIDVGDTVLAMEAAGFEVRDVESLREHYARTLRRWVANLQTPLGRGGRRWSASGGRGSGCCTWPRRPSGSTTAASASTRCSASSPDADDASGMPPTRRDWG